jgi:Tol biopolymer transport system component
LTVFGVLTVFAGPGIQTTEAQYFGRNQVQYQDFDFQVLQTEHFNIYFYEEEREAAEQAGILAERWYARLSRLLNHRLRGRQQIIYYASHPHFTQTNAIGGAPGESTGGVTEVFKRRMVLPFAGPLAETDHVLGHELVHAFQFDMTGQGKTITESTIPMALRLPLWFIEGMAEYLSVGPADPHTAMWIRDAAANDRLPKIAQLYDPRFFPYRFGQAFWAYVSGRWGDDVIGRVLNAAGRTGSAEAALQMVLRIPVDSLVSEWHGSIRRAYDPVREGTRSATEFGTPILTASNSGTINTAPALSPDGEQVVFLSEKDLFAIEMFLADATTGEIERKIVKTASDPHYESLQFLNSAGAWSPDGSLFVFGAVSKGEPTISIVDARGNKIREVLFEDLGEIINPTWSPDGRYVAFSAIVGGLSDLYIYDLESDDLDRVTNDLYADLQPSWSPAGNRIAFVTDRFSSDLDQLRMGNYRLAFYYPETRRIEPAPSFPNAKNINPQWSRNAESLYFVADRKGISNVFRLELATGLLYQITDLYTGVSGITDLSPALSSALASDKIVFTAFENGEYNLYRVDDPDVLRGELVTAVLQDLGTSTLVDADEDLGSLAGAGVLPPNNRDRGEIVSFLDDTEFGLADPNQFSETDYKPSLSLDFISQPYLTAGTDQYGTFIGGGASAYWSDMLGQHNLATTFQINGGFKDIAALVGYENKRHRWNWGLVAGQVPQVSGALFGSFEDSGRVFVETRDLIRQYNRQVSGILSYPFNRVRRVEFSGNVQRITFEREIKQRRFDRFSGQRLEDVDQTIPFGRPLNLLSGSMALVYDNSVFGATSPITGQRYRVQASPTVGSLNFMGVTADARKYWMVKRPFTLAARVTHIGRYGRDAEDAVLNPLYMGYSSLMRGYDFNSFDVNECPPQSANCDTIERLFGSRLIVASTELRFPLFGVLGIGSGMYGVFPVEFLMFGDAGLAWDSRNKAFFLGGDRDPLFSAGAGFRINLFGFLLAEIDYVKAFQRPLFDQFGNQVGNKGPFWQFSFQPGF